MAAPVPYLLGMFVRVKSSPNSPKRAVQIVESIREGSRVRQRIVRHVGTALDEDELKRLRELAEYIKAKLEEESQPGLFPPEQLAQMAIEARGREASTKEALPLDLRRLRERQRIVVGIHEVYGRIYRSLGFDRALVGQWRRPGAAKILFQLVMARIANPASKRRTVADLAASFGVELSLPAVYRALDAIDERTQTRVKQLAFEAAEELLARPVSVLFYDCTTLYFESVAEDDLRQKGFSKENKSHQSQVLVALVVTPEGLPIGYELFPGSTFEGTTLKRALDVLRQNFRVERAIFVADSALLSQANLNLLDEHGIEYIVGARLKSLPKARQRELTAAFAADNGRAKDRLVSWQGADGRRLVVSYSARRAEKDRHDRERALARLEKRLARSKSPASLISNSGYRRFLKLEGESSVVLDQTKIHAAATWDGLRGVTTNAAGLSDDQVLAHYHSLWQIEQCFRISKHDLRIRPIFHWSERRIRAHITLCFMALACVRHLTHRFAIQYEPLSAEAIRRHLSSIQISILGHEETGALYGVPSNITVPARQLYQSVGLKLSNVPYKIS